jgi:nitrogen fixation protein FixH
MSWGKGIAVGIVVFVTEGYYEKGIRYEERLASMRRAAALGHPVAIATEEGALVVRFDRGIVHGSLEGTITLYRPSRRESDQVIPLHADSAGVQRVALAQCDRGLWRVQIVWRSEGEQYYAEEPLILQ